MYVPTFFAMQVTMHVAVRGKVLPRRPICACMGRGRSNDLTTCVSVNWGPGCQTGGTLIPFPLPITHTYTQAQRSELGSVSYYNGYIDKTALSPFKRPDFKVCIRIYMHTYTLVYSLFPYLSRTHSNTHTHFYPPTLPFRHKSPRWTAPRPLP